MNNNDKGFSFFKGAVFGAIAGAVAGLLLAPKSGAETREDLKKLASEIGEKGKDLYLDSKKLVVAKLKVLRDTGEKIDKEKYEGLVNEVLKEVKSDWSVTSDVAKKIGMQLREDWEDVKTALKA